jgi:hypothetical protein
MPKSTNTCNRLLQLVFNAVSWPNIADNAATAPLGNLFIALHTADPGVGNAQTTNEVAYTNYVRIPVVRSPSGWTISTNTAVNTALAQLALCGATGATATHVSVGTSVSGAGNVLYAGALSSSLAINLNIQPQFNAGNLQVVET